MSTQKIIPLKDFFRNPVKTSFKLSPDGKHISFLQPWKNRLNIFIRPVGKDAPTSKAKRITSATERDIREYFWANNDRIAYIQDTGGDENFKLYAVNIDGSNFLELTPFDKVVVHIVDELKEVDDEVLISMNKRNPQVFDVYRLNINTGDLKMIAQNPGNISVWMTDHDGKLRIAMTTDGVNNSILYRDNEEDDFKELIKLNFRENFVPLLFTYDNKNLYVATNIDRDKVAIYLYDIKNRKTVELLFEHSEVDVGGLITSDRRKKVTGIFFVTEKLHYHFLDSKIKSIYNDLQKRLPGYEVSIASMSKDETKILVRTFSDRTRGTYYYYNLQTNYFVKLTDLSPWLNEGDMAKMEPISFKARDGLTINGYLTLPPGRTPKNLPVVVNPHGGPWFRDRWGFNPQIQFLANRGYAVLNLNFRGSTGYGRKFWEASFKQWGRKMQDDISDSVKWIITQGIADPGKIGIYGGSYGGYATLAGLTFTPELYSCGVDYVGVSNMFSWLKAFPPYWKPMLEMIYEMVGHPEKEKEMLEEVSPVYHAHRINAPLFIAQGANDPRVPKAESDQMVEALRKRGVEVRYMVKDNEGHGFLNQENRFDFFREMELFLSEHLGGEKESPKK